MSNIYPYRGVYPTIADSAFTAPSADIIGDVVIGEESTIWFNCTVRGDVNEVRIGKQTSIQDNVVIHVAKLGQGTYVGDRVTVGHSAILHACTIEDVREQEVEFFKNNMLEYCELAKEYNAELFNK